MANPIHAIMHSIPLIPRQHPIVLHTVVSQKHAAPQHHIHRIGGDDISKCSAPSTPASCLPRTPVCGGSATVGAGAPVSQEAATMAVAVAGVERADVPSAIPSSGPLGAAMPSEFLRCPGSPGAAAVVACWPQAAAPATDQNTKGDGPVPPGSPDGRPLRCSNGGLPGVLSSAGVCRRYDGPM